MASPNHLLIALGIGKKPDGVGPPPSVKDRLMGPAAGPRNPQDALAASTTPQAGEEGAEFTCPSCGASLKVTQDAAEKMEPTEAGMPSADALQR